MPDEIWYLISIYLKFLDLFKFSLVSKRFFGIVKGNKKFRPTMTFSKYILNFDEDYFGILKDELRYLSKDIRETFVDNFFVFSLVDVHIEKMILRCCLPKYIVTVFTVEVVADCLDGVMSVVDFL